MFTLLAPENYSGPSCSSLPGLKYQTVGNITCTNLNSEHTTKPIPTSTKSCPISITPLASSTTDPPPATPQYIIPLAVNVCALVLTSTYQLYNHCDLVTEKSRKTENMIPLTTIPEVSVTESVRVQMFTITILGAHDDSTIVGIMSEFKLTTTLLIVVFELLHCICLCLFLYSVFKEHYHN